MLCETDYKLCETFLPLGDYRFHLTAIQFLFLIPYVTASLEKKKSFPVTETIQYTTFAVHGDSTDIVWYRVAWPNGMD